MSLKSIIRTFIASIGRVPWLSSLIRHPLLYSLLRRLPGSGVLYGKGWDRVHPFDREHGTDTSGCLDASDLPHDSTARTHAICYAGSQPSMLREALMDIPSIGSCTFLDLGCGKGRAVLVASEFPFRDIIGVELSPSLAAIARANAALLARQHPSRTAVRILVADASAFPLPAGDLVIFLYHPFGPELVRKVVESVDAALRVSSATIYIVYYNPGAGHCFDSSRLLQRRYARTLMYADEESGFGPDDADTLVIWQGTRTPTPPTEAAANSGIVISADGMRARLVAD